MQTVIWYYLFIHAEISVRINNIVMLSYLCILVLFFLFPSDDVTFSIAGKLQSWFFKSSFFSTLIR